MLKIYLQLKYLNKNMYLCVMKKEEITINGLSLRHVAQIVRRKMIQKSVPSKKVYSRKDKHKQKDFA